MKNEKYKIGDKAHFKNDEYIYTSNFGIKILIPKDRVGEIVDVVKCVNEEDIYFIDIQFPIGELYIIFSVDNNQIEIVR